MGVDYFYKSGFEFFVCYVNVFIEKVGVEGGFLIKINEVY